MSGKFTPFRNQLHKFAKAVHVPYEYMFFDKPPKESVSIPDFRILEGDKFYKPSLNPLAVFDAASLRQDRYQNFAFSQDYPPVEIIRCANIYTDPCYFATQLFSLD